MECLKANFIRKLGPVHGYTLPSIEASNRLWMRPRRLASSLQCSSSSGECRTVESSFYRHKSRAAAGHPLSLGKEPSSVPEGADGSDPNEIVRKDTSKETLSAQLNPGQLNVLLLDAERTKILKKLSEANQYNRALQRQLLVEEDALSKYKEKLAVLELELVGMVGLAEEIANSEILSYSRRKKINGKYTQSHLLARLQAVCGKIKEQIKDVDCLKLEEVPLFWDGMAETVQVMGSFNGWTRGVEMSREYEGGDYARYSATLKLRPGRYEIKFLVDGNWLLSSELPTVGEEMMQNNLLVVEQAK